MKDFVRKDEVLSLVVKAQRSGVLHYSTPSWRGLSVIIVLLLSFSTFMARPW